MIPFFVYYEEPVVVFEKMINFQVCQKGKVVTDTADSGGLFGGVLEEPIESFPECSFILWDYMIKDIYE